jgi:hypothetical protein
MSRLAIGRGFLESGGGILVDRVDAVDEGFVAKVGSGWWDLCLITCWGYGWLEVRKIQHRSSTSGAFSYMFGFAATRHTPELLDTMEENRGSELRSRKVEECILGTAESLRSED